MTNLEKTEHLNALLRFVENKREEMDPMIAPQGTAFLDEQIDLIWEALVDASFFCIKEFANA